MKIIVSKLTGFACASVSDKLKKLNDLIAHLKKRFLPIKTYQWYINSIAKFIMKQQETVSDGYDRLQALLDGTKQALAGKYPGEDNLM